MTPKGLKWRLAWAVFAGALAAVSPAVAQSMEDKLREELRATVTQLHQLQDDQAALQAQKAAAEQERDALKAQLAAAKAQVAAAPRNNGLSSQLESEIAKYKDAYAQAAGVVQQAQAARDKLQAGLANAQNILTACEAKNTQLLDLGNEVLASFESFDFGDAVGANEPFIAIKRVELENLAQDYGDRLYDGKFDPAAVRPAASATSSRKADH
jgi:septal ring factor EnvC (AmiA/AmiB activator)